MRSNGPRELGRWRARGSVGALDGTLTCDVTPILWKILRKCVSTVFRRKVQLRGDLRVGLALVDEACHLQFAFG